VVSVQFNDVKRQSVQPPKQQAQHCCLTQLDPKQAQANEIVIAE